MYKISDRYYLLLPDSEIHDAEAVTINPLVEMIELKAEPEKQHKESFISEFTRQAVGWNFRTSILPKDKLIPSNNTYKKRVEWY